MAGLHQLILRTDMAGMPLEWVDYRDAVRLHFLDQIAYTCGRVLYRVHGGINARTQRQSHVDVNSIIATHGNSRALEKMRNGYVPPLNNQTLFQRDGHICLYCGQHFPKKLLSRDHVRPLSLGGPDHWNNVVTACKHPLVEGGIDRPKNPCKTLTKEGYQPSLYRLRRQNRLHRHDVYSGRSSYSLPYVARSK
ncbi:HNH endonuclease [Sedimenticola selenatireducens]|uniref:HNH endonuclease n=1 Tax=Sedimenticola selenatireducens TaxID=191960 RepID=UPI002AAA8924|nr:HNH endonuclease [Sedimenticola selenatireducens]